MGLKDADLFTGEIDDGRLGAWHANLIHILGKKCVLFVNDKTLFNFLVPGVNRANIRNLDQLFLGHLHPVLAQEGFDVKQRELVASEYQKVAYAKSNSKSVLGSMNDVAFHYENHICSAGSVHSAELPEIIQLLNQMPMSAIASKFPIAALRSHIALEEESKAP